MHVSRVGRFQSDARGAIKADLVARMVARDDVRIRLMWQ